MWHLVWNKLLYVYTNSYGKYPKYVQPEPYNWEEASVWAYLVLAGLVGTFIMAITFACWDMVSDTYWRFMNRHKIKAVTVRIQGKDMSEFKFEKMTGDINDIMAGNRLPGILRTHKLSATDIISMSTVPQHDCFLFTVWYK